MIEIKAYKAECGKKYFSKSGCKNHELICQCWTNPNLKTCMTCEFGRLINDSNGMEDEPQYLQTWMQWDCSNKEFNYDKHFTQAPNDNTKSLCINCPIHKLKIL